MSQSEQTSETAQTQFESFIEEDSDDEVVRFTDYSSTDSDDADVDANECQHCGSSVSDEFIRVLGNNDGLVHACYECSTRGEIERGASISPVMRVRAKRQSIEEELIPGSSAGDTRTGASNTHNNSITDYECSTTEHRR